MSKLLGLTYHYATDPMEDMYEIDIPPEETTGDLIGTASFLVYQFIKTVANATEFEVKSIRDVIVKALDNVIEMESVSTLPIS